MKITFTIETEESFKIGMLDRKQRILDGTENKYYCSHIPTGYLEKVDIEDSDLCLTISEYLNKFEKRLMRVEFFENRYE